MCTGSHGRRGVRRAGGVRGVWEGDDSQNQLLYTDDGLAYWNQEIPHIDTLSFQNHKPPQHTIQMHSLASLLRVT